MAYTRRNTTDGVTVMNKDLYDNLQDGIEESLWVTDSLNLEYLSSFNVGRKVLLTKDKSVPCLFTVQDKKKDSLSVQLSNGNWLNILSNEVDLNTISDSPVELIPVALNTGNYDHIIISGNHSIKNTISIVNSYKMAEILFLGTLTLECEYAFRIIQTGNLRFTGKTVEGNGNTLFYIPQETEEDRASFKIYKFYLKNCTLFELKNSSGYLMCSEISWEFSNKSSCFKVDGTGLSIPPNFIYFDKCGFTGLFDVKLGVDLFYSDCDFVDCEGLFNRCSNIKFVNCNFITRGNSITFQDCTGFSFNGVVLEDTYQSDLFILKDRIRGFSFNGSCQYGSNQGLIINGKEITTGFIVLDLTSNATANQLYNKVLVADEIEVKTFFPCKKAVLGNTGRVAYQSFQVNCKPTGVYSIPQSNCYFKDGYIYSDGTQGIEYLFVPYHN